MTENKLIEINIKNRTCYCRDDLIEINNFDFRNIPGSKILCKDLSIL